MNATSKRTRQLATVAAAVAAGAIAGYLVFDHLFGERALPEGLIQTNGRIEGDRIIVASKFPGRIDRLMAREGDSVTAGQLLVVLEDAQTRAKVEQAREAVAAREAQRQAARRQQAQARRDAERFRGLLAEGTASRHEAEKAELAWRVARDHYASAQAQLNKAKAELAEAESILADLTITAPSAGTITTRMVDGGEVVAAGTPLLGIVDLDRLYLKVYVPEAQIGKLRLGLPARVYTDAFPDRPFAATVRYIASQAEFTPKEVQTPDERVKLVYAVKLYLDENPDHLLTPGLPADAVIRWKEDLPWAKPRW